MEVVPCSRVAHLDRHHLPYSFPDQELLQSNKIRIAEIWMDAYRKIFYRRDTLAHFIRQVGRGQRVGVDRIMHLANILIFFICGAV